MESFNFALSAAQRKCFYEDFGPKSPEQRIEVFVQSGGNMDAKLTIHGPLELSALREETFEDPIFEELVDIQKMSDSDSQTYVKIFSAEEAGTYAFCLDNRFSRYSAKMVEFAMNPIKPLEPIYLRLGLNSSIVDQQVKEIESDLDENRLLESMKTIHRIYQGIRNIQEQQSHDRHRLTLHSEMNFLNYNKVFGGSIFETFVFILVAAFQIFFVRRWFVQRNAARPKGPAPLSQLASNKA